MSTVATSVAAVPSAGECIQEFDLDGDGLLSHAELGTCLEEVLRRGGCDQAKRTSAAMLEEWALRSEGLAAGQGALDRLLRAAAGYIREMTPKEDVQEDEKIAQRLAKKRLHSEKENVEID